ncbi:hypothetical protein JCM19037_1750 [Geomicrobium sp. JCM 19037]|uniref:spore coat protein GerQ n=1 Tax=unclassified Geomicrobium TaxID=2628951 RepID=UPI00045F2B67|nr:spore coat protein GerQ [Geomicrobium sp. JCM 19037]GAK03427.1 hypothetical protein JCM19037_1750 [Geomicrobium sp. JCM 19037]
MYMNPWYGHYPQYPQQPASSQQRQQPQLNVPSPEGSMLPIEQSYIENILRLNFGKEVTIYMTFGSGGNQQTQVFVGQLEEAGRDHIIISDSETGQYYLLLMVYLDYIVFNEQPEYAYPYSGGQIASQSPR